jgi:hypothetical protein
MAAQA